MTDQQCQLLQRALRQHEDTADLLRSLLQESRHLAPPWPPAVPLAAVVRPDQHREVMLRAGQILEGPGEFLAGARFLDFGCGTGHVAALAAGTATSSYGYDPVESTAWPGLRRPGLTLSTDPPAGQFELIVCHDVLDHSARAPAEVLAELRRLLSPGGLLYLRLHPWTSRHGAHQYELEDGNLAYRHLAAPRQDREAGPRTPPFRATRPLATYESLVRGSGLEVLDRKTENQDPEEFFSGELLDDIILHTWRGAVQPQQARKIMAIQHVDYILKCPD